MIRAATSSAEDTRALASALAMVARRGDVWLLVGDLGAGKTTFAQGFARGLGVTGPVTSPTFTLVHLHRGRLTLAHADVYRLDRLGEVDDLGLGELIDDGAVALVEWGDAVASAISTEHVEIRMAVGDEPDRRHFEIAPVGPGWCSRVPELAEVAAPWTERVGRRL